MGLAELKAQIDGISEANIRECALELFSELADEWGGFSDKCNFDEWMEENLILTPKMLNDYMLGYCRNWSDYADGKPHSGEEYRAASLFICREIFKSE